MDRTTLSLPYGQDALISAIAAVRPTTVALLTTGPVTMPWLSKVSSVIELWNAVGNRNVDNVTQFYVSSYADLLSGAYSPMGHLPVTFPADDSQSPVSMGTSTPARNAFWPGVNGTTDLTAAPGSGAYTGYPFYVAKNWPVLFPFGYGLTYSQVVSTFAPTSTCDKRIDRGLAVSSTQCHYDQGLGVALLGRPRRST
jgi:beta-glucosidase